MNAFRAAALVSSMAVVLAVVLAAGCDGRPTTEPGSLNSAASSPPASSAPAAPPASMPPYCADLANATVRGHEFPYAAGPVTLRDGRWWAPDGHVYLKLEPTWVIGALEPSGLPATVGWLVRQASGFPYAYWDIIVCATVVTCVVALSLEDHEKITSVTIKDAVVTVTSRIDPPYANPAVERSVDYVWADRRLRRAGT